MANQIPVASLIADFRLMLAEHWKYKYGAAQQGEVDCSGAFVWAFRQHGISIYHGSNRMARVEVVTLLPINVAHIVPGMVAFKHRAPGDRNYDLPSGYQPGGAYSNGDLNDYYHVGLVDTDTSRVLNAQSEATGFVSSPISENWSHVAYLKQVAYDADETAPPIPAEGTATVYAANGLPVKLRKTASTQLPYLEEVPVGATVTILGPESAGWTPVAYNGRDGYMMSQFLRTGTEAAPTYTITLSGLTDAQAKALAAQYPNNNPLITPTGESGVRS